MADRVITVDMEDADDGSPVILVLGSPVGRVYETTASSNQASFTISDTILKVSIESVPVNVTVTSGGYTISESIVIEPINSVDVLDVNASFDSVVASLAGTIVESIKTGSDHLIYIDWVDGQDNYVGQRDTQYIAPTVSAGSISFTSSTGVTNVYTYSPPANTKTFDEVTISWGRYNDLSLTESTTVTKTYPLTAVVADGPTLFGSGSMLAGETATISWYDESGITGRRYDLAINGVDQGPSVLYPASSWTVSNLPVDGSAVNVVLYWWDDGDLSNIKSVSATMYAYSIPAGSGSQFIIPSSDVPEGQYNSVDWAAGIDDLSSIFWESGGDNITSISEVDGRRAMGVRLDNSRTPSSRVGAGANLPVSDVATIEQWVYFDPDFDWGGSNEGGKLGFGLGGGSRPAGGLTKQDGFTARFMWRTNGQIYAYIYDASTTGYGDDYATGFFATKGEWFHLKMEVGMNSSGGASDGTLKVWVNEALTINRTNMEWFGTGTPQVDSLIHFTFHGGNDSTWTPSRTNHVYFSGIYWDSEAAEAPTYSSPTLIAPSGNIVGSTYTLNWTDPNPKTERRYKPWLDGVSQSYSFLEPATSYTFTGLTPRSHTLQLDWFDDGDWEFGTTSLTLSVTVEAAVSIGADYDAIKTDLDALAANYETFGLFKNTPAYQDEGYYSMPYMMAFASAYRTTGDTSYMDKAIHCGNQWIDSGSVIQTTNNPNGYHSWNPDPATSVTWYNHDHHEWRAAAGIADVLTEMIRGGYEGTAGTKAKWAAFLKKHVWEKWQPGHTNTDDQGRYKSNIGTKGIDFVGRWSLISMGLDKAQAAGLITSSSDYSNYINSATSPLGRFFTIYHSRQSVNNYSINYWTDGTHSDDDTDTSHLGDLFGAILRLHQNGYNPQGKMPQLLGHYENHINNRWFTTDAGWLEYSNSGSVNGTLSLARGMALSAHISTDIKDRWIGYYDRGVFPVNQERRTIHMYAGILSALAGDTW